MLLGEYCERAEARKPFQLSGFGTIILQQTLAVPQMEHDCVAMPVWGCRAASRLTLTWWCLARLMRCIMLCRVTRTGDREDE